MDQNSLSRQMDLGERIRRLEQDREQHAREIAAIDEILAQVSQAVGALPEMERPTLPAPSSGRIEVEVRTGKRGKFQRTGEQSVLDYIRMEENPTTAQINGHWRREGRRGVANVILLRLLKCGLIQREADPAVRGSRYRLSNPASASVDAAALSGNFLGLMGGECDTNGAAADPSAQNLQVH